ncbi:hypothetical protein PHJA_001865800 [Phtheirospermum japonicum]|uniref:Uncharacterized protein n=1 Tax=Phtheirospermum japonicum TaxID=374723 RepID=A0A830C8Z8_9LAMI|nr:hypothetical protein PHJA_001865800 [Phtheirospermum japonicum]
MFDLANPNLSELLIFSAPSFVNYCVFSHVELIAVEFLYRYINVTETSYQRPPIFVEDKKEPLIDLDLIDSTQLWLIRWPINQEKSGE